MKIFKLPDLGEGLQEAEIVTWHVKAGDTVAVDQPLASVETAKAIVDIPSPYAGKIVKLYGNERDVARVVAMPDVRKQLLDIGAEPVANTPEEFAARIKKESTLWAKVVQAARIKFD